MTLTWRVLLNDEKQPNGVLDDEAQRALIVANALSRHGPTYGKTKLLEAEWLCQNLCYRSFIVSLDREITCLFRPTPPLSKQEIWVVDAPHRFSSAVFSQPEFDVYKRWMPDFLEQLFGSMVEKTIHYLYIDDGKSLETAPISLRVAVRTALSLHGRVWRESEPLDSWIDLTDVHRIDHPGDIICKLYVVPGCQLYDINLPVGNGNSSHYLMEVMPELEAGLHAVHIVGHGWDGDFYEFGPIPNGESSFYFL
ncbi:hypothetical protein ACL6C3_21320 [Capilliphycus salinus ALCB114379]|uniref:hypothetical protein n=1 Tax=Capilliphycus salinus TaxID=2768948 RepID=UPI0039A45B3A